MAESKKGIGAEFREFLMRGNVVDLAIAVVIGTAFGMVVSALVADILTPLITAIFGKPSFKGLSFKIHHSIFLYGDFLTSVIGFVSIAAAVFFFVVKPMNMVLARRKRAMAAGADAEPATLSDEAVLLAEIRDLLRSQLAS
jgi:large conductance mechanosensitive channel